MKRIILYIILLIAFLNGCSMIFKPGIDSATTTVFTSIVPDSCDILLINDLVDFRKSNNMFPSNTWTKQRTQSNECQSTYDSINVLVFGEDSADLYIIKPYVNSDTKLSTIGKYYRLRFADDTLVNITPNLITSKNK